MRDLDKHLEEVRIEPGTDHRPTAARQSDLVTPGLQGRAVEDDKIGTEQVLPAMQQGEYCQIDANVGDDVRCRHVAVTRDGIRYIRDKHKAECRWDCQDVGKVLFFFPSG